MWPEFGAKVNLEWLGEKCCDVSGVQPVVIKKRKKKKKKSDRAGVTSVSRKEMAAKANDQP